MDYQKGYENLAILHILRWVVEFFVRTKSLKWLIDITYVIRVPKPMSRIGGTPISEEFPNFLAETVFLHFDPNDPPLSNLKG